jgi:F-type H+-transporting ATPase subunit b
VTLPSLAAEPGYEPGYDFTSLFNTDFVVLIGFLVFLSILFYFNVPAMLGGMLDKRADGIKSELDEARALREEAQTLLASYERKQREVTEQSERIVAQARTDAEAAAEAAKAELAKSIERRLAAAEDQIASAEAKAVRAVSDRAVEVAVAAAGSDHRKPHGRRGCQQPDRRLDRRDLGAAELSAVRARHHAPVRNGRGVFVWRPVSRRDRPARRNPPVRDAPSCRRSSRHWPGSGRGRRSGPDSSSLALRKLSPLIRSIRPMEAMTAALPSIPAMAPTIGLSATIMIVKLPAGAGILGFRCAAATHEAEARRRVVRHFARPAVERWRQEDGEAFGLHFVQKLGRIGGFGQRVLNVAGLVGLDRGGERVGDVVGSGRHWQQQRGKRGGGQGTVHGGISFLTGCRKVAPCSPRMKAGFPVPPSRTAPARWVSDRPAPVWRGRCRGRWRARGKSRRDGRATSGRWRPRGRRNCRAR